MKLLNLLVDYLYCYKPAVLVWLIFLLGLMSAPGVFLLIHWRENWLCPVLGGMMILTCLYILADYIIRFVKYRRAGPGDSGASGCCRVKPGPKNPPARGRAEIMREAVVK